MMLGRRHLHGHGQGGHLHRHRHLTPEELYGHKDFPAHLLGPGAAEFVDDVYSKVPLARRSGSDEKPVNMNTTNMIIGLGVAIPLGIIFIILYFLHRRNMKRVAQEDMDSKYKSLDFGMGDEVPGGKKRRSAFFGKEKDSTPSHKMQLSMDMNLSSPYLLPPDLHQSRESMNSLTRTLHKTEDPYRPVTTTSYANSDVASMRSFQKGAERGSGFTGSVGDRSSSRAQPGPPSRQTSSPTSPLPQVPPSAQTPLRQEFDENSHAPITPSKSEFRFNDAPRIDVSSVSQPEQVPTIQEPPAAASRMSHKANLETVRPLSQEFPNGRDLTANRGPAPGAPPRPPRNDSVPMIDPSVIQDYHEEAANGQAREQNPNDASGLGVPRQDNRRLSVGLRPLPPDDFLDSEDPEFRANRIRSFYKEYFEDSSKPDAERPPMPQPPKPQQPQQLPQHQQQSSYQEDYDQNYYGEAAYYDPDSNAFVMPYAAPVTRRAMTPPPSNRRPMPGPRQRGPGPMSPMHPGGPRGSRPRAGSTLSSTGGGRWNAMSPRPGSSASNAGRFMNQKPLKPIPPPADLNTLPTPSKLKDDSFAILNAMDFAPPPSFKEVASGRSQSPVGERVPYRAGTPVHSPLVSSFDDTAPLPSPHLLRKSGTFTALDFAPPRRFKDPEVMSDTGSAVSHSSGLSSKNAMALRNGAGRVSRLPGDQIFTQADSAQTLKPQWGMRP